MRNELNRIRNNRYWMKVFTRSHSHFFIYPPASFLILVLSLFGFVRAGHSDSGVPGLSPLNPAFLDYIKNRSLQSGSNTERQMSVIIPSPMPPEIHKVQSGRKAMSSLPTRYDMRDPNGDGDQIDTLLPPVRNQGSHSGCWVFGVYGSLESNIKKSFGIEEDFSENHLQHAHGFDIEPYGGGNISVAAAYLSRYDGSVSESEDPYYSPDYCADCSPVRYVDNVIYLPVRSGVHDNEHIKSAVLEYGGLSTTMLFEFKKPTNNPEDYTYNPEACTYYCSKGIDDGPPDNHTVTIVGWDDTMAVENAPGDGAFIVRNCWGTQGSWAGDGGYIYVSYYDTRIAFSSLACFDEKDDTDLEFNKVFYYDKFGLTADFGFRTDFAWGANWFVPDKDGRLTAVGFFATHSSMAYKIYIYDQFYDFIFGGWPIFSQSGEVIYSGWHTVKLDHEISLRKDHAFGVAVRFHTPDYDYPIPVEHPVENYSSQATANPGESYVSANGLFWEDLTELELFENANANVCIKAFSAAVIKGDIDNSGAVGLTDAITGLQLCSGITTPSAEVSSEADVSGDGKIGMEEVIYVLQECAGLRQP